MLTAEARRPAPTGRVVAGSVEDLLADADIREPLGGLDGKSGARFERVIIDGRRYVIKHLHCDDDWVARATGDLACRPMIIWRSGLLDKLPACIDHATLSCAAGLGRGGFGSALLLRDVTDWLVPGGDIMLPLAQHLAFLDHMAALHATFWGWRDTLGLTPLAHRYLLFSQWMTDTEAALGTAEVVPRLAARGWVRFAEAAPRAARVVLSLLAEPWPLLEALEATPTTFLHGDWKAANLGTGPDGRTILLDWGLCGSGPACADLAWYLALNCARLPQGKEQAIACYRRALEARGIDTSDWWETQLSLALLGALVQCGWDKALHGDREDLAWWEEQAVAAIRYLR